MRLSLESCHDCSSPLKTGLVSHYRKPLNTKTQYLFVLDLHSNRSNDCQNNSQRQRRALAIDLTRRHHTLNNEYRERGSFSMKSSLIWIQFYGFKTGLVISLRPRSTVMSPFGDMHSQAFFFNSLTVSLFVQSDRKLSQQYLQEPSS